MDTLTFDERLEATAPFIDAIMRKWVDQLPAPCHTGERPVSVLHGPIPLAPIEGSPRRRYVSVWGSYEGPDDPAQWWAAPRAYRWRWRALRHARRQAGELLIIRTEVKWAESLGR